MKRLLVASAVVLAGCASNLAENPSSRTLRVGPDEPYRQPSAAAAAALNGDTIVIDAGHYTDCSIWNADNLTIRANGDVTIDGPVCDGKGLFVIEGRNATVRGIAFRGARASDGNGAGIRGQGETLTVENSTFRDNQNGILATTVKTGTVTIRNSVFEDNGTCALERLGCSHGIYVAAELLRVEHSTFRRQRVGHHIKSRSGRTELTGNTIEDGTNGTASYLVDLPDGGSLIMQNNILEKGPKSEKPCCAITIGEESTAYPTAEIVLENNRFTNDMPTPVTFLRNNTDATPRLLGNVFRGKVIPVGGPGNS
jgi:nitrous oxidase accessory protein NosD